MVKVGDVWDRTMDVLRGRGGILSGIALLTIVVPTIVNAAFQNFASPDNGLAMLTPVVGIATVVLLVYGVLAITAVASDPAVDRATAFGIAGRRLLPALGLLLALIVLAMLLFIPAGAVLAAAGATITAAGKVNVQGASSGMIALSGLFVLLAALGGLWLSARLVPLFGIVVNERHGIRALRRSLMLTRGSTLKLIGVLILYGILVIVAMLAVTSVVGVIARLALGGDAVATVALLVATASALLSALTTTVQSAFYAQFYVAARAQEQRMAPLA